MAKIINFKKEVEFLGRNGRFKCTGVSLSNSFEGDIVIEPITSKGLVGRSMIEIPKENLNELIDELKKL